MPACSEIASLSCQSRLRNKPRATNRKAKARMAVMIQNVAQKTASFETPKLDEAPGACAHAKEGPSITARLIHSICKVGFVHILILYPPRYLGTSSSFSCVRPSEVVAVHPK